MEQKLFLNQTLIKQIIDKHHEETNWCPRQINEYFFTKNYTQPVTEAMQRGLLGESLCIGTSADSSVTLSLDSKTGKKPIDQVRIEQQAINFKKMALRRKLIVYPGINTQIPIVKKLNEIYVYGTLDIFPTTIFWQDELKPAIIDIKFTRDVESTFGDYSWGEPAYMDHLQADMYLWLIRDFDYDLNISINKSFQESVGYENVFFESVLSSIEKDKFIFLYWVIGHGAKFTNEYIGQQVKIFERSRKDPNGGNLREEELKQRIVLCSKKIKEQQEEGFLPKPSYEICKKCSVNYLNGGYCTEFIKEQVI